MGPLEARTLLDDIIGTKNSLFIYYPFELVFKEKKMKRMTVEES